MRSTYAWFILCKDGPSALVYIGESMDIECRISSPYFFALLKAKRRADDTARAPSGSTLLERRFQYATFRRERAGEASARRLAKSYVEFCGSCGGNSLRSILEVARACAASGFYSEAVYTAAFRSMHDESTESCVRL